MGTIFATDRITKEVLEFINSKRTERRISDEVIKNLIINMMLGVYNINDIMYDSKVYNKAIKELFNERPIRLYGRNMRDVMYGIKAIVDIVEELTPYHLVLMCIGRGKRKKQLTSKKTRECENNTSKLFIRHIKSILKTESREKNFDFAHVELKSDIEDNRKVITGAIDRLSKTNAVIKSDTVKNIAVNILLDLYSSEHLDIKDKRIHKPLLEEKFSVITNTFYNCVSIIEKIIAIIEEFTMYNVKVIYRFEKGIRDTEYIITIDQINRDIQ